MAKNGKVKNSVLIKELREDVTKLAQATRLMNDPPAGMTAAARKDRIKELIGVKGVE